MNVLVQRLQLPLPDLLSQHGRSDDSVTCDPPGAQSVATYKEPTGPAVSCVRWQLNDAQVAAVATLNAQPLRQGDAGR